QMGRRRASPSSEQGRRCRHHQRSRYRRRPCRAAQRRKLDGRGQGRPGAGPSGDVRPARARIRRCAHPHRARLLGYANAKGLWSALYAPAATPRDVLEIVRKAAVQALHSEQVATAFKQQMIRPLPSASIDDAQAWNKAEVAYWKKVTDEVKV